MDRKILVAKVLEKISLDRGESNEIANKIKNLSIKDRNETLKNIIQEKDLNQTDIKELMYDLEHTHKIINLKTPIK